MIPLHDLVWLTEGICTRILSEHMSGSKIGRPCQKVDSRSASPVLVECPRAECELGPKITLEERISGEMVRSVRHATIGGTWHCCSYFGMNTQTFGCTI